MVTAFLPRHGQRLLWRYGPTRVAGVCIAAAWVGLAVQAFQPSWTDQHHGPMLTGHVPDRGVIGGVGWWVVMVVAMMGPAMLGHLHHVAENSLRRRRARAVTLFAAAYLAVWSLPALPVVLLENRVDRDGPVVLVSVVMFAAIWQLLPVTGQGLRDCHRTVALPIIGRVADLAVIQFGRTAGWACVRTCAALMLVTIATGHNLAVMVAVTATILWERMSITPDRTTRHIAVGLSLTGVVLTIGIGIRG